MRILFVGFQDSIHVAQWINLLDRAKYDIHLYCPYLACVNEDVHDITVHIPRFVHRHWEDRVLQAIGWLSRHLQERRFSRVGSLLNRLKQFCDAKTAEYRFFALDFSGLIRRNVVVKFTTLPIPTLVAALIEWFCSQVRCQYSFVSSLFGPRKLQKLIRQVPPDIVHSMEFQRNGYLVMQAKRTFGGAFPVWLASNYGSDLYYFANLPEHKPKLLNLLSQLDYYSCECHRDIELARKLGMKAKALAVLPNSGGINFEKIRRAARQERTSARRVIAVKGYENWAGRAILALQALERCANLLSDYEIVVYRPDAKCSEYVGSLAKTRLRISLQAPTSHTTILELLGRARVYLGVSLSDGLSTSMLEAMAMGAFPIQTCTSCAGEWLQDGRSGFVVPVDVEVIADRIRQAVTDDDLVDRASRENWRICAERANSKDIGRIVMNQYEAINSGDGVRLPRDVGSGDPSKSEPFTPRVSIIIPVYNGAKYVKNAIEDALNQTYRDCEVLVIDDGSTDNTRQIAESYGERIQYFWKANGGVASALNLGIEKMTGSYFSWLSHDDGYLPEKVSCQIEYLQRETDREGVILYSDYEVMNELGESLSFCRWDHEMLQQKPLYGLLRGLVHGCSLLIPRGLFYRFGGFDETLRVTQDYALWFDMIRVVQFKHIPQVLIRSRWHPDQDSKTKSTQHVIPECNALWIRFQKELTKEEILSCEESEGRFFWELARFLEATPYDRARQFAYEKAAEHSSDLTVSVILPFHNQICSTWRALESLRSQTHRRLQIVVIDEGSTDMVDQLRSYAMGDPRVIWLKQDNAGPGNARNAGLSKTTGDFIAFLNSDYSWETNKVEVQLQRMIGNNWAISHTSYVRVSNEGRAETIDSARDQREELRRLIADCPVCTPSVMVRRDLFASRRFPEGVRLGDDVITWLDIAAEYPMWGIDLPLVKKHTSSADDSRERAVSRQNVYNFVVNDPRFRMYLVEMQRLVEAIDARNFETSTSASPAQSTETRRNVKSVLKQAALLVPPVRRYVENHRAVVRELEILRERERIRGDRTSVETLISEVASLKAAVDRLVAETCETRGAPKS